MVESDQTIDREGSTAMSRVREYGMYFLVWTVVAVFFFSQALTQRAFSRDVTPWWHYLVSWLVGAYLSALLTPVILWLGRRLPIERRHWLSQGALHLLFSIVFSLVQLGIESAILSAIGVFPSIMQTWLAAFVFLMIIGFHQGIVAYWTILGIQYGFGYYRRYQERARQALELELHSSQLKAQLARAHLSALKMQLQPHFLFNTLNAIMVLVRQRETEQAEEMLGKLSDLLRCVLEEVESQEVPLRRELDYLNLYLAIELVRFQDRLRVEIEVDPGVMDAAFPPMALQPLVENAIRHGIGRRAAAGKIRIEASRHKETLRVTVEDDGPGLPPGAEAISHGIGLSNTRARLTQLYGYSGHLSIENRIPTGVTAAIVIPYRRISIYPESETMHIHAFDSHAFDNVAG